MIDGGQRLRVLLLAGFDVGTPDDPSPEFFEHLDPSYDSEEKILGYIRSANDHRRHMTDKQKKETAKKLLEGNPNLSSRSVGKMVGLSDKTVEKVRATPVAKTGKPDKAGRAKNPHLRVGADKKTYKMPPKGRVSLSPSLSTATTPGTKTGTSSAKPAKTTKGRPRPRTERHGEDGPDVPGCSRAPPATPRPGSDGIRLGGGGDRGPGRAGRTKVRSATSKPAAPRPRRR